MNYPKYVEIDEEVYPINTDFRCALKCNEIAQDQTVSDYERALAVIYVLFGEKGLEAHHHHKKLLKLARKYLSRGEQAVQSDQKKDMDFIQDYAYIKTSFRSDYNINLDKENMHWWEFFDLVSGLSNNEFGNCCILNRVRNLRNYDTKNIKDPKERQRMEEAQRQVALKENAKKPTASQLHSAQQFFEALNIRKE